MFDDRFLLSLAQAGSWLALLCLVLVPLERLWPVRRQPVLRPGILVDLGYYFLNSLLPALLLSLPVAALAWAVHRVVPYRVHAIAGELPFWARAVAGLVVGDLAYYWAHRMMHTVPWLWRFHAVHHSAEAVDFLVNTRVHPVETVVSRLSGLVPLYVLGLTGGAGAESLPLLVAIVLVGRGWGFFIHANLRCDLGPLGWILSTPAFHQWHHAFAPADRNYASMLPWLDRLFGTYHMPKGAYPDRYGIDSVVAADLPSQLVEPFLRAWPPRSG
jgi:hypothetical protein